MSFITSLTHHLVVATLQLDVAKLDNCHTIVGRGLLALSMCHTLRTLSLSGCRRLTDEAVMNVSHLLSLETLNLEGCRCLTDRSLVATSGLFNLRVLDISQCDLITDAGLDHLEGLENLEELSLGWCRSISNRGLDTLTMHPGRVAWLRVLRLARCNITDNGVEYLGRLLSLEELDLSGCVAIGSAAVGRALEKVGEGHGAVMKCMIGDASFASFELDAANHLESLIIYLVANLLLYFFISPYRCCISRLLTCHTALESCKNSLVHHLRFYTNCVAFSFHLSLSLERSLSFPP